MGFTFSLLSIICGSITIGFACVYTIRAPQPWVRVFGYSMIAISASYLLISSVSIGTYGTGI